MISLYQFSHTESLFGVYGFSSRFFLYAFLPLCIIATRLARTVKIQNIILLAFFSFSMPGEPVWVFLMIVTVLSLAHRSGYGRSKSKTAPRRGCHWLLCLFILAASF